MSLNNNRNKLHMRKKRRANMILSVRNQYMSSSTWAAWCFIKYGFSVAGDLFEGSIVCEVNVRFEELF